MQYFERDGSALIWRNRGETLVITPWGPDSLRIRSALMGEVQDSAVVFDYRFADCILRTDSVVDKERFERIIWETPKDSVQGKQHFKTIDEDNLYYDFTIDSISPAFKLGIGRIITD